MVRVAGQADKPFLRGCPKSKVAECDRCGGMWRAVGDGRCRRTCCHSPRQHVHNSLNSRDHGERQHAAHMNKCISAKSATAVVQSPALRPCSSAHPPAERPRVQTHEGRTAREARSGRGARRRNVEGPHNCLEGRAIVSSGSPALHRQLRHRRERAG